MRNEALRKNGLHLVWVLGGIVAIASAAAAPAGAAELGVGVRAGTQGLGAEAGLGFTEWVTVRAGFYRMSVSENVNEGGIDYDGTLQVGGLGVLADFFPLRGKFRVTAGLFSNDNEIEFAATPTSPQQVGGTTYTPAQIGTLNGVVDFDDTAPYIGIGWGNVARGNRVGFLFDAGVLKQGSGDVTLSSTNPSISQSDLDSEAQEIENDISDYDFWPVISFGVSIRF